MTANFEWDFDKDAENRRKHGVGFDLAEEAFLDPKRVIASDVAHSESEERFYCFGSVRRRNPYRALHVPGARDPHHRRRVLAQGQANR